LLLVQILTLSIGIRALAERFVHNSMKIWKNSKKFEDFSSKWVFTFLSRFLDFCCSICVFDCCFVFHLCFLIISHHFLSNSIKNLSFDFEIFSQKASMVFLWIFSKLDEFNMIFVIVASQKLFVIMRWTTYPNYNEFGKDFRKSFLREWEVWRCSWVIMQNCVDLIRFCAKLFPKCVFRHESINVFEF